MIDTLKLGIPLTQSQHSKLQQLLIKDENWQWVKFQPSTGELKLIRCRGLAHLDQHSFSRDIRWDVSSVYRPNETFLTLELSVPKFWYGHNIHLLYGFVDALNYLKIILNQELHCRFADVMTWQVWRVDCCYSWRCPSQLIAQQMLDSLKRLHFPRKKPIIYPESILFAGGTYSVKFYLKLPEFLQHDRKVLLKDKASLEWINHLEDLAEGVLRYEATLRRKYLKRKKIETVGDLTKGSTKFEWSQEFYDLNEGLTKENEVGFLSIATLAVTDYVVGDKLKADPTLADKMLKLGHYPLKDGEVFYAPPHVSSIFGDRQFLYGGGGFTVRIIDNPTNLLQYFLTKFLGDNRKMQEAEQVEVKLLQKYKRSKAARLMSIWLYVQKFGRAKAKDIFGDNPYYVAQRDIKAAGCSFVEPPKVTSVDDEFLKSFDFSVPSPYVTNTVDDFRDSSNLINLLPHIAKKAFEEMQNP